MLNKKCVDQKRKSKRNERNVRKNEMKLRAIINL